MSKLSVVGQYVPSIDALPKVTGQTQYLQDIKIPGMLYGKILRSPHAHARIREIDVTRARQLSGVRAVITAHEVPPVLYSVDPTFPDKEILCSKKVRFVGDEIAAVAADTPEIAEQAIKLIDVQYELIPGIFDPEDAMQNGSPLVHESKSNNIFAREEKDFGNVEKGFAESDYIFEDTFVASRQAHCCMETKGCMVQHDEGGQITVWLPTQAPHNVRGQLSRALGIERAKIRIISTPVGGAFGQKVVMDTNIPIALFLSKYARRPVKLMNTREEEFIAGRTGYGMKVHLRTGVTREGKLLAKQARIIMDNGAYSDQGLGILRFAGVVFSVLYDCPNISYHGFLVYTNQQPCTAFRGFGNPQISFAFESHFDRIAIELGIDPLEIRQRNSNKSGHTIATNAFINTCSIKECLEETARLSKWEEKRRLYDHQDKSARLQRGIGIAAMTHTGCSTRASGFLASGALIKISDDGIVSVITPLAELGQGGRTAIAQIVAEGSGVKMADVRVISADTDILPYSPGAFGSRQTFVDGHAALAAALEAKRELLSAAAKMLNCQSEELEIANGLVFFKNKREQPMATTQEVAQYFTQVLGKSISVSGNFADESAPEGGRTKEFSTYIPVYTFGCQAIEVEVDQESGEVRVLKAISVNDSGRTINPLGAEGQMEGALSQALGYALMEDFIIKNGTVKSDSFIDYKTMRAEDMPEMEVSFIEPNDLGPYGSKGIGESGVVCTPSAVASAVFQATGVLIKDLPITPEKILRAIQTKGKLGEKEL